MNIELKKRLEQAWEEYKIYAYGCIEAGSFPAPFGATKEEQLLKEEVRKYHGYGVAVPTPKKR